MDFDPYDVVSRIYGLSGVHRGERELVGTIRIAGQSPGPTASAIEDLSSESVHWKRLLAETRLATLPLLDYLIDGDAVRRLCDAIVARGERVAEPGRFVVLPSHRAQRSVRHLARHLIECATALFFVLEIENAILTTFPEHRRLYQPLGFRDAEGTQERFHPTLNAVKACLHGTAEWIPAGMRERILALAGRYKRTSGFCLCPTFPDCLPNSYATGDFGGIDLFCPIRARELNGLTATA
jgi:GNAT superfamily N-acetyltransferase